MNDISENERAVYQCAAFFFWLCFVATVVACCVKPSTENVLITLGVAIMAVPTAIDSTRKAVRR